MKRPFLLSKIPLRPELYPIEPEVRLWRAVIDQAIQDFVDPHSEGCTKHDRKRAQVWLRANSQDFWEVCYLACLDPLIVVRIIHDTVGGRNALFEDKA